MSKNLNFKYQKKTFNIICFMQWDLHLLLPGLRTFPALFKKYSITWNWSQYNMLTENSSSDVNVFCSEFLNCKIPSVMFQFRFYLSCYSVNIQTGKNSSGSIFKNKKFVLLMSVYFVENCEFPPVLFLWRFLL